MREETIRRVRDGDLAALRDIETAAGRIFADIGMHEIAEDEPPPLETLSRYQVDGHAWVAVDATDSPIAYLLVDPVDGNAHIEQVSVHPGSAGHGIGRSLIEHVAGWAVERGMPALTLTAFTEVPWNGPYYERCGFRRLGATELTPGLRDIREREAAHGLDKWPRTCMRRDL